MPHPLIDSISAHAQMFVKFRRELQSSSEHGLAELRTSDLVVGRLEQWGYRVERFGEGRGVVAQLRRGRGSKRLGLRAGMGPLSDAGDQGAASQFGHTAMLLAAAHYLARQGDFNGTLNLIFQGAEPEQDGAQRMVAEGLFAQFPCDAVFAMRSAHGEAQGRLLLREGPALASCDEACITLHGETTDRAADPVVAGAAIVMGLQSIAARHAGRHPVAQVQVHRFETDGGPCAVAQTATLQLGVRTLDQGMRDQLERRITALAELQALSYGAQATVAYHRRAPVLVNTAVETEFARQVALELLGPGQVEGLASAFAGQDDFACMLEQVPGSYLLIGNGPEQEFNERNLPIGAAYWAMLAQCYLH